MQTKKRMPKSFATHDGSFHADEITACALLLLYDLIDKKQIYRSRKKEVFSSCEFICDVGGIYDESKKCFDHHQVSYKGNLSSAGMVLLYLLHTQKIEPSFYDYLNQELIASVDAYDTGNVDLPKINLGSFSDVIANFMPVEYGASSKELDKAFHKALEFVVWYLKNLQKRFSFSQSCMSILKKEMDKKQKVMFFEKAIPWVENFFALGGEKHPALFLIMPAAQHWKLRGIPPSYKDRMKVRLAHPKSWSGLQGKELQQVSGIAGARFCHKGLFISIWDTKEDALKALSIIQSQNKSRF